MTKLFHVLKQLNQLAKLEQLPQVEFLFQWQIFVFQLLAFVDKVDNQSGRFVTGDFMLFFCHNRGHQVGLQLDILNSVQLVSQAGQEGVEAGILLQEQVNPRLGLQISLCRAACREGVEGNEEMADPAVRTKKGRVKPSNIIKRDKYESYTV